MKEQLIIKIKTLTPIWTGGVTGTCSMLHETGIIGSLRWWYEAVIRGLGGQACDLNKHKCSFNQDLCDVCKIFGTTGWRRQFSMDISHNETKPAWDGDLILNIRPPQRTRGWFLPAGKIGNLTLKIRGDSRAVYNLASLFLFLEKWGALGAKSQLGYGFFKIINHNDVKKYMKNFTITESENDRTDLPDLRYWLIFKYRFKPSRDDWWTRVKGLQRLIGDRKTFKVLSQLVQNEMVPVSPVLKNQWRFEEWKESYPAPQWLFGISKGDRGANRIKSKIAVSWAYREDDMWVIKGWVWMPKQNKKENEMQQHQLEIDALINILGDKMIWSKALNLDYTCPTDLYVDRITSKEKVIELLRGGT